MRNASCMAERRILGYAIRGLLVVIAGFVVFDVTSAYAIGHHAPFYVALAIGALTCPVVPVVWHVFGERTRKRKRAALKVAPKAKASGKSGMTGLERLLLRAGAIGALVIGSIVALTSGSWQLIRHNALWFVPHTEPVLGSDSPLIALVPARAEAILWIRPTQAASDAVSTLGADAELLETVIAVGGQDGSPTGLDTAVITRFPAALPVLPTWLLALGVPAMPALPVGPVAAPFGLTWRATTGWAAAIGSGPPTNVVALATRAPGDALAVFLAKPTRGRDAESLVDAVAYVTLRDKTFALVAELDAVSPEAGETLRADLDRLVTTARTLAFTTVTCLQAHGATFELTRDGARVQLHAALDSDAVHACMPSR
jgi:hypothetical protein